MALAAAREVAETEGLRGLTARRVAGKIGYSAGTLYNLFENLDDLIVHLNGATLDALYQALAGERPHGEPEAALRAMARTYIGFTGRHPNLWNILFEHRLPEGQELPEGHREKVRRLLGLVESALSSLFAPGREGERLHAARVLWCGLNGICSLTSAGTSPESAEAMADSLIINYVQGLRHGASRSMRPLSPA